MSGEDDIVALQSTPLDIAAATTAVGDDECGAIAVFVGTTRADKNSEGRALVALNYEAYGEMAQRQMRELAQEARKRWPIRRVAMLHRTGAVKVGEPSVLVVVSTPHRAEAFEACRFLIDKLKAQVTIWKKEIWGDGSSTWVSA